MTPSHGALTAHYNPPECPLLTQSGHQPAAKEINPEGMPRPKDLAGSNRSRHSQIRRLRHKNRVGQRIVRHICADGLLSRPRPVFGCLKFRPMMSTKSSRLTLAFGSFYEGNDGTALYNPNFRPFRSPVPLLLMRRAVISDWKFFLNNKEWLPLWARSYGVS